MSFHGGLIGVLTVVIVSDSDKTLLWDGLNIQKAETVCQEQLAIRYGCALLIYSSLNKTLHFKRQIKTIGTRDFT
jgi:prolipoprotein diacylglyceryltransferase